MVAGMIWSGMMMMKGKADEDDVEFSKWTTVVSGGGQRQEKSGTETSWRPVVEVKTCVKETVNLGDGRVGGEVLEQVRLITDKGNVSTVKRLQQIYDGERLDDSSVLLEFEGPVLLERVKVGCRRCLEEPYHLHSDATDARDVAGRQSWKRGGHDRTEECRDEGQENAEGKNEAERMNQAHRVLLNRSDQVKHRKSKLLLKGQRRTVVKIISVKREKEENNLL